MITGLTEEQFYHLPGVSLHYPCDTCGEKHTYGHILRDFKDYWLQDDGAITTKARYTALYLCSGCHWTMTCEYQHMEKESKRRIQQIRSNEARWLQRVSHLTIRELADRVGVSRQAYHKWLRGKTITEEHKAQLKELIASYIQEHIEDDETELYFACGFTFVNREK